MADTIDQQFIEYIVKALVGNVEKVRVERTIDERGVLLELYVDPEDLGRVIGRSGTTAKSIRTLLRALGTKNDARYNLKIVDTGDGSARRERQEDQTQENKAADDGHTHSDDAHTHDDGTANHDNAQEVAMTTPDEPIGDSDISASDATSDAVADETQAEEPQSDMDRHRADLKDLTDLDI